MEGATQAPVIDMDILGIDIGTVSVKYLRIRGKGVIISHGDYPHKGGWEDLNFVLTDIKDKEGTDVEIAIAVSSPDILKRSFSIPVMPRDEAKEAIEWAASKVVTTSLEDMIYENIMLGQINERGLQKEEVFFIGANKEYIDILLSVFETVGFRRVNIITDCGVLYLPIIAEKKEGTVAVVDIGGRQTGIYIFDEKRLRFMREILTASESFIDTLMSEFGLSYDEAEQYIIEKGFNEESKNILSFPLDRLTGEVQRTFNVYTRKHPERPITKIYITGRASRIPNLISRIQDAFMEEVERLMSPIEIDEQFLPLYALCMKTEPLVNLLPEKLKARKREMTLQSWLRLATICVVAILLIPSIIMLTDLRKMQVFIKSEQADVASKKEQLRLLGSITTDSRYGELMALNKEVGKKDVTFVTLLKYLSSRLPRDVYIREIGFTDKNKRFDSTIKDLSREHSTKEGSGIRETAKTTPKEDAEASAPSKGAIPATGQSTLAIIPGEPDYAVTLRGYIFGDIDVLEPALVNLVISIERYALLRNVEVSMRETKEIRGKKALEFIITGQCIRHEI
ncbi:MAG TPA: pilus assembly protein PilM [Syntrophorhabdus sp.]|nr:pilus assembly protein PilM [Syntrophorhabdus sp.]NMC95449.1 pilus assembly protein PilM [Syntrophorhabdus sp.]HQB35042.1 pilus assembly protein PilM [Syntrophorhabdus sp.]HQG24592.1 pilus assembly protein PilM [Syntrophorhabdus sp.]HQI97055.1 pilus assembly protein PilM [Syntrophorhabdus sp.]